ncbi:hypothetical protein L6R52_11200 [Myxococcota bacterium]|nr:hypothetical protein [Myxococcota bacterium]
MSALVVRVGPSALTITVDGPRSSALVPALFSVDAGPAEGRTIALADVGDTLVATDHDGTSLAMARAGDAASWLTERVTFHLAEPCTDGLFVHAGLTVDRGRGIAWLGPSGAGKSTLVAWCVHARGHRYLSDEAVHLDGRRARGLRRALHLKPGSVGVATRAGLVPPGGLAHEGGLLVPLHAGTRDVEVPLGALVFPRYDAAGDGALVPLTRARAVHRLLQATLNVTNHADRGLAAAVALVADVPAFTLDYGTFAQLDTLDPLGA